MDAGFSDSIVMAIGGRFEGAQRGLLRTLGGVQPDRVASLARRFHAAPRPALVLHAWEMPSTWLPAIPYV